MHEEFRRLLEGATGKSQHIIAIVLDIRGFTPFCEKVDSLEVATYIKRVYMKIIDNYFSGASFFKPTGDGLLVIVPYDEGSLKERANKTVENCLKLLGDFRDMCSGDPMITFDTPTEIGIGMARGSACCITSEEKILDYSGKVLNLASRLMNVARPSGIVLDSKFGLMLLSTETQKLFLKDNVYIRGIAEEKPFSIHYTKEHTLIPDSFKKPIREPRWETIGHKMLFKVMKAIPSPYYFIDLKHDPLDKEKIFGDVSYFYQLEGTEKTYIRRHNFDIKKEIFDYEQKGRRHYVTFALKPLIEFLESKEVEDDIELTISVTYLTL